jgi:hypothetical protein
MHAACTHICQTHNSCFSCSRCLFAAARHLGLDGGDSSSSISSLLLSGAVRLWLAFRFGVGDELPAAPYYSFRVVMWLLKQPVALGGSLAAPQRPGGVSTTPPHKCGGNSACGVPGHPQPWHASGQLGQYVRHPWPWLQAVVALRHHDNCL